MIKYETLRTRIHDYYRLFYIDTWVDSGRVALNFIHSTAYNCSLLFREGSLMKNRRVPFSRDEHEWIDWKKNCNKWQKGCLSYEANNYIIKVITILDNRCIIDIKTLLHLIETHQGTTFENFSWIRLKKDDRKSLRYARDVRAECTFTRLIVPSVGCSLPTDD